MFDRTGNTKIRKKNYPATDYERIFHPQKLAILGVSAGENSIGFGAGILKAILAMGFEGKIFPVNPKGGEIAGLSIYKRVEDIPEDIDFAIVSVAARFVPEALEACRKKGAAGAQILSSGFSELGTPEGQALERQIQEVAAKGIRVVGPNCFGIYCPRSALTLLPGPDLSRESGPVGFLAQSGGMSIDFAHAGKWMGIRFSKMVSFGNGADLREAELLHYLASDPETKVITMYIEGIKDGEAFFREMKAATSQKPVIVYKGGLSRAGARAVASHTASMGGSRAIWQSIIRQAGAIQVADTEEMAQVTMAFSMLPQKSFRNITVVGGGGAIGVTACDLAETHGIEIPSLSAELQERIWNHLPKPGSSATNPIDVANPFVGPQALREVLLAAAEDPRIDLQMIVSLLFHYKGLAQAMNLPVSAVTPFRELAQAVRDVVDRTGKPVIAVLPNVKRELESMDVTEVIAMARQEYINRGIPVFDEMHDAIRAIARVNTYYGGRKK